jgi:transcriptional regulator with XRE-family HTH domain
MNSLTALLAARRSERRLPDPDACRLIRERAGLTQRELAGVIGVSRATVSRWESGRRIPRGPTLRRYLDALDVMAAPAPGGETTS